MDKQLGWATRHHLALASVLTLTMVACESESEKEARYQVARATCSNLGAQAAMVQPGRINQPFAIAVTAKCLADMGFEREAKQAFTK